MLKNEIYLIKESHATGFDGWVIPAMYTWNPNSKKKTAQLIKTFEGFEGDLYYDSFKMLEQNGLRYIMTVARDQNDPWNFWHGYMLKGSDYDTVKDMNHQQVRDWFEKRKAGEN